MQKILVLHQFSGPGIEMLRKAGFDVVIEESKEDESSIVRLLRKHSPDALVSFLTDKVTQRVISSHPGLKIISNFAVGFDNIDVEAAKASKIAVANTPSDGYAVAEFTAGLVVTLARRILESDEFAVKGNYKGWEPELFVGMSLRGKTLGIVGSGRIGSAAAGILSRGFGMNVIYSDIAQNADIERDLKARRVETDELFKTADVVSLHVALTPETRHLVDSRRLSLMKPSALLVNTSRGPVVDEEALINALKAKKISGAALDVFEFEPKISKGLRKLENVVLTPHIASATREARDEMSRKVAQNVINFFLGKRPEGVVYLP